MTPLSTSNVKSHSLNVRYVFKALFFQSSPLRLFFHMKRHRIVFMSTVVGLWTWMSSVIYEEHPEQFLRGPIFKAVCYMAFIYLYAIVHRFMNRFLTTAVSNEAFNYEYLLQSEVKRCVLSTIWIVALQFVLGRHSPVSLWLLVYTSLGSIAFEISPPCNLPIPYNKAFFYSSSVARYLTYATNIAMSICVGCAMAYQGCNIGEVITSLCGVFVMQILTVELIDFMKTQSFQYIDERKQEVEKDLSDLYKELYMTSPDAFITVMIVEKNTSRSAMLDHCEIVHYNDAVQKLVGTDSSLNGTTLKQIIAEPSDMTSDSKELEITQKKSLGLLCWALDQDNYSSSKTYETIQPIFIKNNDGHKTKCAMYISKLDHEELLLPCFNIIIHKISEFDVLNSK